MHDNVMVSIIIPHRNNSTSLKQCLLAIRAQVIEGGDYEIIVVDNGSTEIINRSVYDLVDHWLTYNEEPNPYICRNLGIRHAKGSIIVLVDSTCIPFAGWLEAGVKAVGAGARVVAGSFDVKYREGCAYQIFYALSHLGNAQAIYHRAPVVGGNLFVDKNMFNEVGLFPSASRSGGDTSWSRSVWEAGHDIVYVAAARVEIRAKTKAALISAEQRFGRGAYLQSIDKPLRYHLKMVLYHLLPDKASRIRERIAYQNDPEPFQQRFWMLWWVTWHTNLLFLRGYLSAMLHLR